MIRNLISERKVVISGPVHQIRQAALRKNRRQWRWPLGTPWIRHYWGGSADQLMLHLSRPQTTLSQGLLQCIVNFSLVPVADPAARWEGRGVQAEEHDIYETAFGVHLFYDLFLQGPGGVAPKPPSWIRYWVQMYLSGEILLFHHCYQVNRLYYKCDIATDD